MTPYDDDRPATKGDLGRLHDATKGDLNRFRDEIQGELNLFRGEIRGEIGQLRDELRAEMRQMRVELTDELTERMRDMQTEVIRAFQNWVGPVQVQLRSIPQIETRLSLVEERLTALEQGRGPKLSH